MTQSHAALSDHRFESPLSPEDQIQPLSTIEMDLDLMRLKLEAEQKGIERAEFVLKTLPKESLTVKIFHFLTLNRYRRGPMRYIEENRDQHLSKIEIAIRCNKPIELILSFFGYKTLNSLKTFGIDGTEVDISEVGSILRFYEIVSGIQRLYPPGAVFKVSCDGMKYSRAVGFADQQGHGYYENVRRISQFFGICDKVRILEEAAYFPEDYMDRMCLAAQNVYNQYYYEARVANEEFIRHVDAMARSMMYIIPLPVTEYKTLLLAYCNSISDPMLREIDRPAHDLRMWIKEEALKRALKFVAAYNAIRDAHVIEKMSPNALRATVHPKPGQIGLYSLNKETNNLFAHHGQGVTSVASLSPSVDNLRIRFKVDILRHKSPITGITLPKEKYPFSNGVHPFMFVDKNILES